MTQFVPVSVPGELFAEKQPDKNLTAAKNRQSVWKPFDYQNIGMLWLWRLGLIFFEAERWQEKVKLFSYRAILWRSLVRPAGEIRGISSSGGVDPLPVACLVQANHLLPFLPPAYPLLSQFTLFPLWEVLNWCSLAHPNSAHLTPLSFLPLVQVCWASSPSYSGAPDPVSSTPHRPTSLARPTTAARPSMPSRSALVRSFGLLLTRRLHQEPLKLNGLICIDAGTGKTDPRSDCVG